ADEAYERAIVEVAFADLNEIDAPAGRRGDAPQQLRRVKSEAAAVGDQVADHGASCRRTRDATRDPTSTRPARAVTRPTPVTPPRAYGLLTISSSAGRASANRLCSQNVDHGAT